MWGRIDLINKKIDDLYNLRIKLVERKEKIQTELMEVDQEIQRRLRSSYVLRS